MPKNKPIHYLRQVLPILEWLPQYKLSYVPYDIVAGLTVGLTLLPVSLAYAQMANLRPEFGLYSSFFGQIIYMFLGTCREAVVGPSALGSMLVGRFNLLNPLSSEGDNTYAEALAFVSGTVILLFGMLRFGFVSNFFSIPVISGFSTAACCAIVGSQLMSLFGVHTAFHGSSFVFVRQIKHIFDYGNEIRLADTILGLSIIAFLLSIDLICSLAITTIQRRYVNGRSPGTFASAIIGFLRILAASRNSVAFILATTISYLIEKSTDNPNYRLTLVGHIKPGMPIWHLPRFHLEAGSLSGNLPIGLPHFLDHADPHLTALNLTALGSVAQDVAHITHNITQTVGGPLVETTYEMMSKLSTAFIAMPIMSMAEMFAIVRAMGRKSGYDVRPTNELVAIGVANIFQSFVGAHPITVATAKTVLNNQCKVKSQLSSLISAAIVIISTATLTEVFFYVPKSALAAILISAALHLFDYPTAIDIWRLYRPDLFFFFFTFGICLFYNLAFGVLVSIALSLGAILWSNVREPQMAVVNPAMERQLVRLMSTTGSHPTAAPTRQNRTEESDDDDDTDLYNIAGPTVTIFMKRDVRFPGAENFTRRMMRCLRDPNGDGSVTVRRLVIDGRFCRHVDYTSLQAWRAILIQAAKDHKSLFFMNFSRSIRSKLEFILRPIEADFIFDDDRMDFVGAKTKRQSHCRSLSKQDRSSAKLLSETCENGVVEDGEEGLQLQNLHDDSVKIVYQNSSSIISSIDHTADVEKNLQN